MQMKKVVVASREEALKLIGEGVNSMLVFSDEAPHGYKKDGTPAAPRGRKPLTEETKAARLAKAEEKAAASGKVRVKTGPLVRTPDAPFGVKKDGTPMLKRGRPTKDVAVARKAAASAEREARRLAREEARAERKAARAEAKATKAVEAAAVPPTESPELSATESPVTPVEAAELPSRGPALEVSEFKEGMKVRLREAVCTGESSLSLQGTITKVDENFAHIQWSNGDTEYRSKEVIEVIA
jgi:hypothetical protein